MNADGFLAKLSPDGSSLNYSTYFGGSGTESVNSMAVDAAGNAYLGGTTNSNDFPLQAAFRTTGGGFAAKFDSSGKLVWSSLLGDATPRAMAVAPAGDLYLTGISSSGTFATPGGLGQFISGNIFRTTDGGTSWTGSTLETQVPTVSPVVVDPKTPSRVFALADHLYNSNDGGQSWTQLGLPGGLPFAPFPFGSGPALVLDPFNPTTMYEAGGFCAVVNGVSGGCGLSKSTDGGLTWTSNPINLANTASQNPVIVSGLAIDPKTPSTLYAAVGIGGIYKSTDAGATWSPSGALTIAGAVAVDPINPSVVYASIGNALPPAPQPPGGSIPGFLGISKSVDAGATWTTITNGLPTGWFANFLVVDPVVPGRVYAVGYFTTTSVYRRDNGGNNWVAIGAGLPGSSINALAIDPTKSSVLYAAPSTGGLYRSADAGSTWKLVPGLQVPIVNSIAIAPSDPSRVYAGTQINPGDAFVMKITQ